jgi:ATP-binding cassette subfamily F protein uup
VNVLTLERVNKSYGEKVLFADLSLQINRGQKIGLVAKNGTGKSTLLRVAAGLERPEGESATVLLHRDIRMAYLGQEPEFYPEHTILEAVLDSENPVIRAIRAYEEALLHPSRTEALQRASLRMDDLKAWDMEARMKEVLTKLRVDEMERLVKTLSGGEKKRLALAKIIIEEPDFLILDEPTNHLDLDMVEWLEDYLGQPNLSTLMVTHDRYFLERVCDQIIELEGGRLYRYSGNYSDFLEKKATRHETENAELDKDRKLFRKELEWVKRMPKGRGTKAKSRVGAFEELRAKVKNRQEHRELQIDLKGQRLGKKILEAHNIGKRYGDKVLVEGFTYKFKKGERAGIIGPNGVGKTTFLRLLTRDIRTDTGKVVVGGNTVFGYYTQSGILLEQDKRVIDMIRDIAEYIPLEKGQKLTAEQLLERFLFDRKQQQVYVSKLSGGERRRLYLLTVLMENPNFLILDEPTNDLDIITLNVLEEFLLEFPGCILIVSHDRYFMDKVVDHLFVFEGEGRIRDFNGTYSEYRAQAKAEERARRRRAQAQPKKSDPAGLGDSPGGLSFEERKELKRLEKAVQKLEQRKAGIHAEFATGELPPDRIAELSRELDALEQQIADKEMRWMELAELV